MLREILRGGADAVAEAGASIVGGHSIDDPEPKYGLAVTGHRRPARDPDQRGGAPGDTLVLTKPLGAGTIATALKRGLAVAGARRARRRGHDDPQRARGAGRPARRAPTP